MKKYFTGLFAAIFVSLTALLLVSCYEPNPLYGTWSDNDGNKITFISDGTFTANVYDTKNNKVMFSGDFTVIDNVIVFSYTTKSGDEELSGKMNTEWDIRGAMLYLTWTYDGTKSLTLYHVSK